MSFALNIVLSLSLNLAIPAPQQDTIVQGGMLKESYIVSSRRPAIGVKRLTSDQFSVAPTILGEKDILKTVQMIPGITGGKEGNAGIMIRGGDYDQTDFEMDGGTLFNPAHLLGFVSAYNPETTGDLDVYKGELPAWFGGRLSGLVDVHGRDGDFTKYHAGITVGLLSANVWAEGPILKDRLSFIAGGRKSYFNLIMYPLYRKIANQGSFLDAFDNLGYYDANARLSYRAGARDHLALTFYIGNDNINQGLNKTGGTMPVIAEQSDAGSVMRDDRFDTSSAQRWGNIMGALNWTHSFQNGGDLFGTISYSFFRNAVISKSHLDYLKYAEREDMEEISPKMFRKFTVTTELEKGASSTDFLRRNRIDDLKADFRFSKSFGSHNITLGALASNQNLGLDIVSSSWNTVNKLYPTPSDDSWESNNKADSTSRLTAIALYADDIFQILPSLTIRAGLRGNMWSVKGKSYFCLEPRASIKWTHKDVLSVAAGYNRTSQAIHQLSSSSITAPGDIWVPVTPDIKPMTANQYYMEVGAAIPLGENPLKLTVEGYYKTMDNLLEWTDLSRTSDDVDWTKNVSTGRGTAYGVEFSAEKTMGKLYASLAYTWSKSLRQFDDLNYGEEFYATNDRRHNVNFLAWYRFSDKWDLSAAFSYHTGDRFTLNNFAILGNMFIYFNPSITTVPVDTGERNNYCLKDYHRLDLSLNYHIFHRKAQSTINLSIYNVYNRLNPYTLQFDRDEQDRPVVYNICIMPFMPSLAYTLKF